MKRSRVLGFVVVSLLVPVFATAQQRPMTLVDLINVPRLAEPQLSPDGKQVLFVLGDADWKANKRINHIWRVNVDGTSQVQLTNGTRGESSPRWSPDGSMIAFLTQRADDAATQIHLIPNAGGEARPLTEHPSAVSSLTWSPDGRSIFFLASDPKTEEEKARERLQDDVIAFDENYKQQHIWKVSVADRSTQRVTEGDYSVVEYTLAQDGRKIAFHKAPNPLLGYADEREVWLIDANGGGAVQITRNAVPETGAELSPDGSQVLFLAGTNDKFDKYYNRKIFVVPSSGGTPRRLAGDQTYEVEQANWSQDGRSIYFLANLGVHSQLFQLDTSTGRARQLTTGNHALGNWSLAGGDRHIVTKDEPTNAGDVWVIGAGGEPAARVTRVFDFLAREYQLPKQEKTSWKGADGVTVEGMLYYPLDYQPGQKYPLAVQTHGGPQSSDKFGFGNSSSYIPVLTAKGYFVFKPNYRGSTGYGDPFLRDMVGGYYTNSHLDVITGVDHLIKLGLVDPDRMVKMGWSGGGHMTNKIITFTTRFKAASAGAGATNWISMYAQSDTRTNRTPWFGGTPWQKNAPIEVYWNNSPLKYVSNVTTPTIILVGEKDERVPAPQSVEMYRALKSLGVPTHLYIAPREPHGWQELRHQLFKMNVELDWFEKYATKRPYEWEKAPGSSRPRAVTTTLQDGRN
jgi:dipeptidyl aminopeptidase/acylaminoacyl peptidase